MYIQGVRGKLTKEQSKMKNTTSQTKNETNSHATMLLAKFDINEIKDGLTDLGHDIDIFETKSDFIGYLECLAEGTCGSAGKSDFEQLRTDLIADAETMKNYDREVARENLNRFGFNR
jgi:hypothetical protein